MFGLELGQAATPTPFLRGGEILLVNARSCIALVVDQLRPARVWLPSYLCEAVVRAADRGPSIEFYPVDCRLRSPCPRWLERVRPGDLVIAIHYFGFPFDSQCQSAAKDHGALILEDACQALLTKGVGKNADFVLFSPRKFLGVPDGGILHSKMRFDVAHLAPPPDPWWLQAFKASVLRREFDRHGGERSWFELFQDVEESTPTGRYQASSLAQMLWTNAVNYEFVSLQRRRNFELLSERLGDIALFGELTPEVVPLGFPICVQDRAAVRERLFAEAIYPAIHWPIDGTVPGSFVESHRLAHEILTLPCDQRYDAEDMSRMANLVREAI